MSGAGKFAPRPAGGAAGPVGSARSVRESFTGPETVKMSLNFDGELRTVLKVQAAREGRAMRDVVEDAVRVYLRGKGVL